MKNKLAARGAAIAVAAMMAAGLGTGSVREAMAATRIPIKKVTDTATVSNNGLEISPTVTVTSATAVKKILKNQAVAPKTEKVPKNQAVTPKTESQTVTTKSEKSEENQTSGTPETADVSEAPAAEEPVSEEITGKTKENTGSVKGDTEETEGRQEKTEPDVTEVPDKTKKEDQKPGKEKELSVLADEQKSAETNETSINNNSESFQSEASAAPTEVLKEAESEENIPVTSEPSVKEEESESEEETSDKGQIADRKNSAEDAVQENKREEKDNVSAETTGVPADPAESDPIPEPLKEPEAEAVLVGSAGQTQTVGASSGATQIVGDTTKRYETNTARAVITASPQRNTAAPNKGDLLAPKASNRSSSTQNRTTPSSGSRTGRKSSGSSTQDGSYSGSDRRRIRTSTPQTGDHSGAILYAMMAGASLAAAAAAILALKKER